MKTVRFNARIKIKGVNPYVLVNKARAAQVKSGWRKPLPVLVRINGLPESPWHINMMPTGKGSFYLYLHGDVRKASQTKVGDMVNVEVCFDSEYHSGPMHPMPLWLKKELEKNPKEKKNWELLTPSRQKEILRYFAALKSVEAKKRNLTRILHILSGKKGRFMAKDWEGGK